VDMCKSLQGSQSHTCSCSLGKLLLKYSNKCL